jgi:hypothetical protein
MAEKSDLIDKNFGVMIAFWLPGFLLLWGLTYSFPPITLLLPKAEGEAPTVGGFLYVTLASLAAGLVVSAIRWMVMDRILFPAIGLRESKIDFGKLRNADTYAVFQGAVENHYRYYQYYSNTLISILAAVIAALITKGLHAVGCLIWLGLIVACVALFLAARDCFSKYHERVGQIAA